MAQPVQQVAIRSPGFEGLNTELSPINGDPEFALVADNVVVDQIGRLASRKAFADYAQIDQFIKTDLNMDGRDWRGFSIKPNAFAIMYVVATGNQITNGAEDSTLRINTSYNPADRDLFFDGSVTPLITLSSVADMDAYAVPGGMTSPRYEINWYTAYNALSEETKCRFVARMNGTIFQEEVLFNGSTYPGNRKWISWKIPNPNEKITFELVADGAPNEGDSRDISIWIGHLELSVYDADNDSKVFNEIIKLGKDIQATTVVQEQAIERPVMIYRYGDGYEYPPDTRSVPVGMGRKQAVRAGLPELTGTQKYGVAIQLADGVADLILPNDYDGPSLLTGQFVNFNAEDITAGNDRLLLFAKGKPFLRLDNDSSWTPVTTTYPIDGDIAISAYGRVWVTGVGGDYHTIHYSALLDETKWYTTDDPTFNDAGIIDVREYWPVDGDSIVNIHAHNGYLLIFGRNSILVYANADSGSPAGIINQEGSGIFLQDAIANVGLVRRDAICNIGTDVLFVDDSGVRSIGRVIQEKSNPLQEPSLNIRREIQEVIQAEVLQAPSHSAIKLSYMPSESIAVLLFASLKIAYVFHLNMPSKTGGMKVTRWTDCFWNDAIELKQDQKDVVFLAGKPSKGLMKYDGYLEGGLNGFPEPYVMRYESMALALGQSPMQTTIPKSINYVCVGDFVPGQANALWGFADRFVGNREFQIDVDGDGSKYAVNEFGSSAQDQDGNVLGGPTDLASYYSMGSSYYRGYKINTTGSGELFRVGFEVKVQGGRYALQEIDINSAIGRLTA
jgi:hypothetical protein